MARATSSLFAALLAVAAALETAAREATTVGVTTANWVTEHHDIRNSGLGDFTGPGEATGVCTADFIDENMFDTSAPYYYSTGILTDDNEYMIVGNGANFLQIIQVETQAIVNVNLTAMLSLANATGPVSTWGVTASGSVTQVPTNATDIIVLTDQLYQGSADGHLYAFNPEVCAVLHGAQPSFLERDPQHPNVYSTNMKKFRDAAIARGVDLKAEPLKAIPCLQWITSFNQPVYAPTRFIPKDAAGRFPGGLVLVSETAENTDSDGILHAVDASNGVIVWNMSTSYITATGATATAGLRYVPAINMQGGTNDPIGYIGFGRDVVAFNVYSGVIIGSTNNTQIANPFRTTDLFVSSPTLTSNGNNLYIHSATGTLWSIALTITGNSSATLNIVWACDYFISGPSPVCDTIPPTPASKSFSVPRFDMEQLTLSTKTIRTADLVSGGFSQPTTAAELAELEATIRSEWLVRYGSVNLPEASLTHIKQVAAETDARKLLQTLPTSVIQSMVTASGYCMLNALGKPAIYDVAALFSPSELAVSARPLLAHVLATTTAAATRPPLTYGGIFPYATPSLTLADARIMVAQYQVNSGPSALFAVDPATGNQVWYLQNISTNGFVVPFGRSRSSPAIDQSGNVYVATDADELTYTMPLLIAVKPDGSFNWLSRVGGDNVRIGSASPIVGQGFKGEHRLYMVSGYNVIAVDEGIACPGMVNPFTFCSGNGVCNCKTGVCTCSNPCRSGDDCSTLNTCNGHGTCNADDGCVCDPCFTGPNCDIPKDCGAHGTCNPANNECLCKDCYMGPTCELPINCGAHGTCNPATSMCVCSDTCYMGAFCDTLNTCNGRGTCSAGTCTCTNKCSSGANCEIMNTCNGNGICDAANGLCNCDLCFSDHSCSTASVCNGHGICARGKGCSCQDGYGPGFSAATCVACGFCKTGMNCQDTVQCGGHGTCNNSTGGCACAPGFEPSTMCTTCDSCHGGISTGCTTVINACSGHGTCVPDVGCACAPGYSGADCSVTPSTAGTAGAVAAGILIPAVIGVAAAGLCFWKKRNPLKPWSALLPQSVAKRMGGGSTSYSKLQFSTSGTTPKDIRQPIAKSSGYGTT